LGSYRSAVTSALGVGVFLPTGKQEAYTSDGHVRVVPRLSFAGAAGPIDWALSGGVQVTKQTGDYANRPSGTAVTFSAAVGVRTMDDKLLVGPEVYGFTGTKELLQRESSPVEGILSARYWMTPGLRIGAGAGTGLTTGFGASRLRALATLEWVAPIEAGPGDRDKDGILDPDDACPDTAGVKTSDPKTNGCPVSDRDADGILDADDACPDEKGPKSDDPKRNGCPVMAPKDRDGDGILDADDACPDEVGKASSDPKTNGCPVRDRDKDGILDSEDACPDQAGPKDADPKKNGCPAVRVENGQIKIIDQVKFRTASSVILPESDGILNNVAAVLKERTEITKVRVEGHTDNRGAAGANKTLSQQRAAAVVAWLIKHGIDAKRLTNQGFGQDRPVDTNDTETGRQNNRRVEFHIE
jgi:outer membrane protein OmpA-like peptidoglycan-associated protein